MERFSPPFRSFELNATQHSKQADDKLPVSEMLRDALAKSNRELLRKLAAQSSEGSMNFDARSVDEISQQVADQILADSPELLAAAQCKTDLPIESSPVSSPVHVVNSDQKMTPIIKDLSAVPWSIWVGEKHQRPTSQAGICDVGGGVFTPSVAATFCPLNRGDFSRQASSQATGLHQEETEPSVSTTTQATMSAGLRMFSQTHQQTWMSWDQQPKNVLLVAKPGDADVIRVLREVAVWLDSQQVTILVEPALLREIQGHQPESRDMLCRSYSRQRFASASSKEEIQRKHIRWGWHSTAPHEVCSDLPPQFAERCRTWTPAEDSLEEACDLVICFGGDGTLCWAASLFNGAIPPVLAFAGGSLGFLTPFSMKDWMSVLVPLVGANLRGHVRRPVPLACRTRFQLSLRRRRDRPTDSEDDEDGEPYYPMGVLALNEVLVHRHESTLAKLVVCVGKTRITTVQGDGLILATPTGSTAYSLAAGGSMVHPSVPGIILTPVCPHSLSFRPVVLPNSQVVRVSVPSSARGTAKVAVDGKDLAELGRGDSIEVCVSQFPLPTICKKSETEDWFLTVNEALKWNLRDEQKGIPYL